VALSWGQAAAGARIMADPTTTPVAISLAPTTQALPTGLVPEKPVGVATGAWGPLPRSW
jgi:hypothetical protein